MATIESLWKTVFDIYIFENRCVTPRLFQDFENRRRKVCTERGSYISCFSTIFIRNISLYSKYLMR
jgi:hypothetical protein